jgi:hypothetical protein
MKRFYRLKQDATGNDVLDITDVCAIQGDRIEIVPEKYNNVLFYLGIDANDKLFVRDELCLEVPDGVIADVTAWINTVEDMIALPTYYYDHILLNGVDRIPRLYLVYIAENEESVWDFINN